MYTCVRQNKGSDMNTKDSGSISRIRNGLGVFSKGETKITHGWYTARFQIDRGVAQKVKLTLVEAMVEPSPSMLKSLRVLLSPSPFTRASPMIQF